MEAPVPVLLGFNKSLLINSSHLTEETNRIGYKYMNQVDSFLTLLTVTPYFQVATSTKHFNAFMEVRSTHFAIVALVFNAIATVAFLYYR